MKKICLLLCTAVVVFFSLTFTVYAADTTTAATQDAITTTQVTTQAQECNHTSCEMKVTKKASLKSNGTQIKVCKDCGYEFSKEYTIRKIKSVKLSNTSYVYSTKKRTPKVTVLDSKSNEISSDYYDVTYQKGRKNVGTYIVTVKFKGKYKGSKTLKFNIVPKSTSISKVTAVSRGAVVNWKKQNVKTTGYQVRYSKNSDFKTKKTVTVKGKDKTKVAILNLAGSTKYYFKVRTYKTIDGKNYYSSWSKAKSTTTKKRVTVFAGDSITEGLKKSSYNGISKIKISGSKHVVSYIGVGTLTFQTNAAFNGLTGLEKVISYKPSRVYIMLGMNEITWRSVSDMIDSYAELIEEIQYESPYSQIVLLSVSPVTSSVASKRTGFKKISSFNKKVKSLAEEYGLEYYDFTSEFKNSSGYLKSEYNGGDGIHWNAKGYAKYASIITSLDKKLDKNKEIVE